MDVSRIPVKSLFLFNKNQSLGTYKRDGKRQEKTFFYSKNRKEASKTYENDSQRLIID